MTGSITAEEYATNAIRTTTLSLAVASGLRVAAVEGQSRVATIEGSSRLATVEGNSRVQRG